MKTALRLIIAACGLALLTVFSATVQAEDYTYTTNNGTITITKYTGPGGDVTIPSTIQGLPVTSIWGGWPGAFQGSSVSRITIPESVTNIGQTAFHSCTSLTNVTIGNSVTSIGEGAFSGCTSLASIVFPDSVTSIGYYTFSGCSSLTSVVIPKSVTYIGGWWVQGCRSLTAIEVDPANPSFSSLEGVLLDKKQTTIIQCPEGKTGAYVIPSSVTGIADHAFWGCSSLRSVVIPNSVTSIGERAFSGCTSLTSIVFPDSVTSIGDWAFVDCSSLTNVTISDSVTHIGGWAFARCTSLAGIEIPRSVTLHEYSEFVGSGVQDASTGLRTFAVNGRITITGYNGPAGAVIIPSTIHGLIVNSIGPSAFAGTWEQPNTNLTSVTIPDSVVSLEGIGVVMGGVVGPFPNCTSLTNVVIGQSVTNIGDGSFMGCTSLAQIVIPKSVTRIGTRAFAHCTNLTSVTIPDGVTDFGQSLFSGCTGLTNIPDGITWISSGMFWGCTSLTSVTIPNSVTNIGYAAFSDCTRLKSIVIPESVASIADEAFFNCASLTGVTIPDSVTSIGVAAFVGCTSLTSIVIPDSVTSIGQAAFYGCTSLTGIYFAGNAPQTNGDLFPESPLVIGYYLPGTTGWGTTFGSRPTAVWVRPNPVILKSTLTTQTNAFGFRISWATNTPVVVEASTSLAAPNWSAISTNTLTGGWTDFRDSEWTNYPSRFYRVRAQ